MKQKNIVLIIMLIVVIFTALFQMYVFNNNLKNQIIKNVYNQLLELSSQNVISIDSQINEQFSKLKTLADNFSHSDKLGDYEQILLMNDLVKNNGFLRCAIAYPDGSFITNDKQSNGNVSNQVFFKEALKGKPYVSEPIPAVLETSKSIIMFSVPIIRYNEVAGVISCSYETKEIDKLFSLSFFNGMGYSYISKSDGTIIFDSDKNNTFSEGENILDYFRSKHDDYTYSNIKSNIKNSTGGVFFIENDNGKKSYASYCPLSVNDWYVFTIVPEDVISEQLIFIENMVINSATVIFTCSLILVSYIVFQQIKARNKAIVHERCLCALAEQTGKVIFEWGFVKRKITILCNFNENFGINPESLLLLDGDMKLNIIHPDDINIFKKMYDDMSKGINVENKKLRIKNNHDNYYYFTFSGIVINDWRNRPYKIIGSLENIDRQERESELLHQKASRDQLTGLYNKVTSQTLISNILEQDETVTHALICADLDNFKMVNDTFGHLYGDEVLMEVANKIKEMFRSTDVLGRFGGDEFVLLIRDIPNVDFIKEKISEFISHFNKIYDVNGREYKISMSIGISIFNRDGLTYEDLYKKADEALYEAKRAGKDMYCIYGECLKNL